MYLPPPTLIETRKLKTHPNNPRYIRKQKMEELKRSILEDPHMMGAKALWVNPQMVVFSGNQRLRACQALGWEKVPCIILDWTEEEQERAMIKDNGHHGEWDMDILGNSNHEPEQLPTVQPPAPQRPQKNSRQCRFLNPNPKRTWQASCHGAWPTRP